MVPGERVRDTVVGPEWCDQCKLRLRCDPYIGGQVVACKNYEADYITLTRGTA